MSSRASFLTSRKVLLETLRSSGSYFELSLTMTRQYSILIISKKFLRSQPCINWFLRNIRRLSLWRALSRLRFHARSAERGIPKIAARRDPRGNPNSQQQVARRRRYARARTNPIRSDGNARRSHSISARSVAKSGVYGVFLGRHYVRADYLLSAPGVQRGGQLSDRSARCRSFHHQCRHLGRGLRDIHDHRTALIWRSRDRDDRGCQPSRLQRHLHDGRGNDRFHDCRSLGSNPGAYVSGGTATGSVVLTAVATDTLLPANVVEYLSVSPGQHWLP